MEAIHGMYFNSFVILSALEKHHHSCEVILHSRVENVQCLVKICIIENPTFNFDPPYSSVTMFSKFFLKVTGREIINVSEEVRVKTGPDL